MYLAIMVMKRFVSSLRYALKETFCAMHFTAITLLVVFYSGSESFVRPKLYHVSWDNGLG